MAGELLAQFPTGSTLYAVLLNASGQPWNGAAFDSTPTAGEWTSYDIAMTEDSTTGHYRGTMPVVAAGAYSYHVHLQVAGAPATTDPVVWVDVGEWNGTGWGVATSVWAGITQAAMNSITETWLKYDMSAIVGEAARSPLNALRFLRNKWTTTGGTLTVYEEDDTTTAWTAPLTTDASGVPITGMDPT